MTDTLRIHLFGPFEIFRKGQLLTNQDWRSQQTRSIAKILIARRRKVVTSDQIIELVWPDDLPDIARSRLHVRISQLRKAIGGGKAFLQTLDGGYIFTPDASCWLDVDEFQAWITEAQRYQESGQQPQAIQTYELARSLYRDDYLVEDLYSDWTVAEREFYRERFLDLLIELSECYAQQGRFRLATTRAREALAIDPLREIIYVRLMLYHYYAGERTQALNVFERCQKVLAEELSVSPLTTTLEIESQIRAGTLWRNSTTPRYPPPMYEGRLFEVPFISGEIPFVGRELEYAWLIAQWQNQDQRIILLEGEVGIGKTRLIEVFSQYIKTQGARVLHARISPSEHSPLGPLAAALHPLLEDRVLTKLSPTTLAALAAILPDLRSPQGHINPLPALPLQADRERLYKAVSALGAACADPSIILIVDDAHRLNAVAVNILSQLSPFIKLLLSYRSEDTPFNHPIREVFKSAARKLEPLPPNAVKEIVYRLSGHDLPDISKQISGQSSGNPLFVVALLQHLFEIGKYYVDTEGHWAVTDKEISELPPSLYATISARLQRLNRQQRRIFDFAVVVGGEFDFDLLQNVSKENEESLLSILDELIDLALIQETRNTDRGEFIISHDRYIEVEYATIPVPRRKQTHRLVAQVIESLYAGQLSNYLPSLADHYDKAEDSERAVHYATLAGEQAVAQFAGDQALRYLGRALDLLSPENIVQRAHLLLLREKIYNLQGVRQAQNEDLTALEAICAQVSPGQQADIYLRRATYEWLLGNNPSADTALNQAISQAQKCGAIEIEARAHLLKGRIAQDQSEGQISLTIARQLAQKSKLLALEGDVIRYLGNSFFWQNKFLESQAFFEQALSIHREVGDLRGELSTLNNLAKVLQVLGSPKPAVRYHQKALATCRMIGDRLAEGVLLTNLGSLTAELGDFQQAQKWLQQAIVIRDEIGNDEGVAVVHTNLGDVYRQQGSFSRALSHYDAALAINDRIQHKGQYGHTLSALSALYLNFGDKLRAEELLRQAFDVLTNETSPSYLQALINTSLLEHLRGKNSDALSLGTRALKHSQNLPHLEASAKTILGHALAALEKVDEAHCNYEQALIIYRELSESS